MKKVLFLKNALILTATSLILRSVGIVFRVWLAAKIGAEGIGLYQVIMSVYVLASTFATSGISTAVTRIVTACLAENDKKGTVRTLRISVYLSLFIAAVTALILTAFSNQIACSFVHDSRAGLSLKVLCISLPFMGACSCLRGYFLARRKALSPSFCQIIEQSVRICMVIFLINRYSQSGLSVTCAAVIFADAVSEAVGCFAVYLCYKLDKHNIKHKACKPLGRRACMKELLRISVPISSGRYLHTALRTIENLITPVCFAAYCASQSRGFEQFGVIKGMALPILLFPASLLSSVSTLLVPEMTEALEKNNNRAIRAAAEKVFYITSLLSFFIGGVFFAVSQQIGLLIYKSNDVGYLIRALSPLVPFMYIDLISDGILKGLDQQKVLFRNNVIDSLVRIALVAVLVPNFGMTGFLGVMLFSNVFTSLMAVIRIVKITKMDLNLKIYCLKPLVAVFFSAAVMERICRPLEKNAVLFIAAVTLGSAVLYFLLLNAFGGINTERILNAKERAVRTF